MRGLDGGALDDPAVHLEAARCGARGEVAFLGRGEDDRVLAQLGAWTAAAVGWRQAGHGVASARLKVSAHTHGLDTHESEPWMPSQPAANAERSVG